MPMIITVTLAQGAKRMTRKKVLVKQLAAIEDFGSIDIRTWASASSVKQHPTDKENLNVAHA